MTFNSNTHKLSDQENEAIFERSIKSDLFSGIQAVDKPVAIIFGGQPGSGKSVAIDAAAQGLSAKGGVVQIIGDDLRGYHPSHHSLMQKDDRVAATHTGADIGKWVERAIEHAKQLRCNIAIEGTMRDPMTVKRTMTDLKQAGYEIDARVLVVSDKWSELGILARYEKQKLAKGHGRMTSAQAHDAAYLGLPDSLALIERERLADKVSLYRRFETMPFYENKLTDGVWQAGKESAVAALLNERNKPMAPQELRMYAEGYDQVFSNLTRPGRNATAQEVNHVEALRNQAYKDLAQLIRAPQGGDQ